MACAPDPVHARRRALLRGIAIAAAAASLPSLPGCGGRTPALPKLGPQDVVLAFGDSLTYGTGARAEESYPAVLAGLINRNVVRSGVPGEQTAGGLARLPDVLAEHGPRLVLLCLGGNDMLRKQPGDAIVANLRAMARLIRGQGRALVLLAVPQPAIFGGAATFYAELAKELDVPLEPSVINDVLRDNGLKSDPIHPNAAGYRKIAEAVAALLRRAGAV
jgi:lysophospholipase L1-like esterase